MVIFIDLQNNRNILDILSSELSFFKIISHLNFSQRSKQSLGGKILCEDEGYRLLHGLFSICFPPTYGGSRWQSTYQWNSIEGREKNRKTLYSGQI